jgi:hypothetical protein
MPERAFGLISTDRPLKIGPRNGEARPGGPGWTRQIDRVLFWFRLTPDGKRLMVQRIPLGDRYAAKYVHTLYAPGVDPDEYERGLSSYPGTGSR